MSAAIFGDASLAQFPYFPFSQQFEALYDRGLDLSTTQSASNMVRDVYQVRVIPSPWAKWNPIIC
jgi:hypothetical protein